GRARADLRDGGTAERLRRARVRPGADAARRSRAGPGRAARVGSTDGVRLRRLLRVCGRDRRGTDEVVRRGACVVFTLAAFAGGSATAGSPRLVIKPAAPAIGEKATIELHAKAMPPVYVTLRAPGGPPTRIRLRKVGRTVWRATYSFETAGVWMLSSRGAVAYVDVELLPASSFVPLGAPGCTPPSPANSTTREARGGATTGDLWALFGSLAEPRLAVLSG